MTARMNFTRALTLALIASALWSAAGLSASDRSDGEAATSDGSRFAFGQGIDAGEASAGDADAEYLSFSLGKEHYRACRADLGDIRIFDAFGSQCPYVIDSREVSVSRETKRVAAAETGRGVSGEGDESVSWREYQLVDFEDPLEVNALALDVGSGEYSARLDARARDAKSNWAPVATDTVYRISGVEKSSIEFDSIVSYAFWRIEFQGAEFPFGEATLTAVLDRERSETSEYRQKTDLSFEIQSKGGRTTIKVENPDRLAVSSLSFEAPSPFRRTVSVTADKTLMARDEIYRIKKGADEARQTSIDFDSAVRDEAIEIAINDGDDAPLAVSRIIAEYAVDRIVFRPTGKPPYRLAFGNGVVAPPKYDMSRYRDEIAESPVRPVVLLPVEETAGFRPDSADANAGKTVFSVVVVITSLALSSLVIVMLFRRKETGAR